MTTVHLLMKLSRDVESRRQRTNDLLAVIAVQLIQEENNSEQGLKRNTGKHSSVFVILFVLVNVVMAVATARS